MRPSPDDETVACAKCGKSIWAYAQRCPYCGIHFSGEAWEFRLAQNQPHHIHRRWVVITAVVLLIVFILIYVLRAG